MLNIVSGDLYRLRKSKSFIICIAAIILITVFSYLIIEWALKVANGEMSNTAGAVHVTVNDAVVELKSSEIIGEVVSSKYATIIFAIFVCVWVTSEFVSGAMKNIVGKGCSRVKVFLAKYITAVGIVFVMNIISYVIAVFMGLVFAGTDGVDAKFYIELLKYVGMQLMLVSAYVGIIVAVCEVTRSLVAGIVVSVVIEMFSLKITAGFDLLLKLIGIDAEVSKYWIVDVIYDCSVGEIDTELIVRGIIVTIVWTAVSLAIGMWHFKKKDIK